MKYSFFLPPIIGFVRKKQNFYNFLVEIVVVMWYNNYVNVRDSRMALLIKYDSIIIIYAHIVTIIHNKGKCGSTQRCYSVTLIMSVQKTALRRQLMTY